MVLDAVSPSDRGDAPPLALRLGSVALQLICTSLAASMMLGDYRFCLVRPRLLPTGLCSFLASCAVAAYALAYELKCADGSAALGDMATTACSVACASDTNGWLTHSSLLTPHRIAVSLGLLVWNAVRSATLADEDCDEDSCVRDSALSESEARAAAASEAARRASEELQEAVPPATALLDHTARYPIVVVGYGLLSFAITTTLFSLFAAVGSSAGLDSSFADYIQMDELSSPTPALPAAAAGADGPVDPASLLLNVLTLGVAAAVLRAEARGCAVQPAPRALRAAAAGGFCCALAALAFVGLGPGGAAAAAGVCTVAFSMMLCAWNVVRFYAIPGDGGAEEEEEEEEVEVCEKA